MDKTERVIKLHKILAGRRTPIGVQELMDRLETSRATVYRDINYLRDYLQAPVETGDDGVWYDHQQDDRFELPGMWLTPDELNALLAVQAMAARTQGGLRDLLAPLEKRVNTMFEKTVGGKRRPALERLRMLPHQIRNIPDEVFRVIATAVLQRTRLEFDYRARTTGERTHRVVSPQLLTYYRDTWYLDAIDETKRQFRRFSLDCISKPTLIDERAADMSDEELARETEGGYGIFSGDGRNIATIVFSQKMARWVADQVWHPDQQARFLPDGRFELRVPYSNSSELLMDVLQFGEGAEVIAPIKLREQVRATLMLALNKYEP